ncbi:MAG: ATP-binding protein [Terrimicrobiaceae bacterium]|nr:ATP-binding protein [Terrimicrobiaceae bacterium]
MELTLKTDFAEIPPASDAVERFLAGQGASQEILYLARLVIEELVTNTIKYGYDDHAPHEIRIGARIVNRTLVLEVSDDGHPFNPLDIPEPDTHLPAHERPIGGLGLHLVRRMTDSLRYERRDGRNIVTVRKSPAF